MYIKNSALIILLAWSASPMLTWAHGSMSSPPSRQFYCKELRNNGGAHLNDPACKALFEVTPNAYYDWQSFAQGNANGNHQAVVPANLCSANRAEFNGVNATRNDWHVTEISPGADGKYTFIYDATAPHATRYFRTYLTKDSWNPSKPVTWADLEQVGDSSSFSAQSQYTWKGMLPTRANSRQVLFTVWQRSDSAEAFYSCSDIKISGAGTPPESGNPVPPIFSSPWVNATGSVTSITARSPLPVNTIVRLREFSSIGADIARYDYKVEPGKNSASQWSYELAKVINANSATTRVGKRDGQLVPQAVVSATENAIFTKNTARGSYYEIEYINGGNSIDPPGPGNFPAWKVSGGNYRAGDKVSHGGRNWRALNAHSTYGDPNWAPGIAQNLWSPI
ncbi:lytic polysaccharide monooxygenase [Chromobacterium vaccinii]|uniref:Lytic polysaccharide monooxygenase n=1 Tax=Chromobacterium vaccinii TaxID=1108595 RepID=A0ABV0FFS8_9NEIS